MSLSSLATYIGIASCHFSNKLGAGSPANSQPAGMGVAHHSGPLTLDPRTLLAWSAISNCGHPLFHLPSFTAHGSSPLYSNSVLRVFALVFKSLVAFIVIFKSRRGNNNLYSDILNLQVYPPCLAVFKVLNTQSCFYTRSSISVCESPIKIPLQYSWVGECPFTSLILTAQSPRDLHFSETNAVPLA